MIFICIFENVKEAQRKSRIDTHIFYAAVGTGSQAARRGEGGWGIWGGQGGSEVQQEKEEGGKKQQDHTQKEPMRNAQSAK